MNIHNTIHDTKQLAQWVRDQFGDDDELLADMLEGETNAFEALDTLLEREAVIRSHITAMKARKQEVADRLATLEVRQKNGRTIMGKLLEAMQSRKVERAEGTVSFRAVAPSVIDGPVSTLPDRLTKTEVKPDKAAIKEALQAGEEIPGWAMSNGGETISVRRK